MTNPIIDLKIDVNKSANYETVTVKQGDINSRTYKITLVSNGQIVTLATTDSVKAKAERGGETVAFIACTKSGNEITLTLSSAMLAVAGTLKVELIVYSSNGAKLTSATQIFVVDRSIPESPIVATPDFSALTDMVNRAEAAITAPTVDGELKDARGGETALRYRLEKIESGQRIAQGVITNNHLAYDAVDTEEIINGAVTLDKMSAEAKAAFAAKDHNHNGVYIPNTNGAVTPALLSAAVKALFAAASHDHDGAYIPNTSGAVTPALLSAAAKALFAQLEYAGAAKFLPDDITVRASSIKGAVNAAAIQSAAVTTGKLEDGAVTEQKIAEAFIEKYGYLPYASVSDFQADGTIPYDNYVSNGITLFTGRYVPVVLIAIVGGINYVTQIKIQADEVQTRARITGTWTDWNGGKTEIAESFTQLDAQIAQLQVDTQAHGSKLDTLDRVYAGTATIAATTSYKVDAAQVAPNSKVYLTLTNGPSTSCFVRSDYYPLYYYGTNQVVQPEYNKPIPVSAEDLTAGVKLNYGGAFTIQYQTASSQVFFDYSGEAAETAAEKVKQDIKQEYEPYVKNQIIGKSDGAVVGIKDAAPESSIKNLVIKGATTVTPGTDGAADVVTAVIPKKIKLLGSNLLKMVKQEKKAFFGISYESDGNVMKLSGSCTGGNIPLLDSLAKYDGPITIHLQVLSGSSADGGMYFLNGAWMNFVSQTRYYAQGINEWTPPRSFWVTNNAVFSDDFTCRFWATPGNTPNEPYEEYKETIYEIPSGIVLYSTPNNEYRDTYDVTTGTLTKNCAVLPLKNGWIYNYSQSSETITWITDPLYLPYKKYYTVLNGKVIDTAATDWQGKISMVIRKDAAGVTAEDTSGTARTKILAYLGNGYAILPIKAPTVEQKEPVQITVPGATYIAADKGDISEYYYRDANMAYLGQIEYTTELEARVAQLEINMKGGATI